MIHFTLADLLEKRLHQPGEGGLLAAQVFAQQSLADAGLYSDLPLQNPAPLDESGQRLGKLDIHC